MSARPEWDFDYSPVPTSAGDDDGEACDVVVAFFSPAEPDAIVAALSARLAAPEVQTLLERAPLFWLRVRSSTSARRDDVKAWLAGFDVRYVASATRGSQALGPALEWRRALPARATSWKGRVPSDLPVDDRSDGRWYLRGDEGGVAVDRSCCGTGAGTRLAVIDDDALDSELVGLDALVSVGGASPPLATFHGPLLIGWAVGTVTTRDDPRAVFTGVAPDASPRLYCIPKSGTDVCSLATAIVDAVDDGADVVLCPTYVEGSTSPMLDDALEFARRLGRQGLGAVVVMPGGREASSPAHSVHSSWTLALRDPASDPRVFCIGPSGRGGAWFLWRDRKGGYRPFGNRGPALRWLAPGDDIAYPFEARERPFHAESSGAAAIAAGVLLLVLSSNPTLRASELSALVTRTCVPARPATRAPIADPHDLFPSGRDGDGHDAKHGYGLLHATRACLAARDPLAFALVAIGDDRAAARWIALRARDVRFASAWSLELGWSCVRLLLGDPDTLHALSVLVRHARLLVGHPERRVAHGDGALIRSVVLLLRSLESLRGVNAMIDNEIKYLMATARYAPSSDSALLEALAPLWKERTGEVRPSAIAGAADVA